MIQESNMSHHWSMDDERNLLHNIFSTRFNYFVVVFSLVLNAAFLEKAAEIKTEIFVVGILLLLMMWLLLFRVGRKYVLALEKLREDKNHPARILSKHNADWPLPMHSLMYAWVPVLCISALLYLFFTTYSST